MAGCDDDSDTLDTSAMVDQNSPSPGPVASTSSSSPSSSPPTITGLSTLGSQADANQQAFRQRFNLTEPTPEMLAQMDVYDARFTEYSDNENDWKYPTTAAANWQGATWNGDPMAIAGTTVAVDFNRIPRGSLLYIPALDMYAEANDTGATQLWANDDAYKSDYGASGAGRVDIYNRSEGRSSTQIESSFSNWIGSNEYGKIYIVSRKTGWKSKL